MGGVASGSGGVVEANTLRDVPRALNGFEDNRQGPNPIGPAGMKATTVSAGFDLLAADLEQSRVATIEINHNRVKRSHVAMVFTGRISSDSPGVVVDNRAESVDLGRNPLSRDPWDCLGNDEIVVGDERGAASGSAALVS